jgi:hypothetical protein
VSEQNRMGAHRRRLTKVRQAQRRHAVLELVASGMTSDQVADALTTEWAKDAEPGITARAVDGIVAREMGKLERSDSRTVEALRNRQLWRLDRMVLALWNTAIASNTAPNTRIKAVREIRNLTLAQAELAGTKAPIQHEHSGNLNVAVFDADEIARFERMRQERARQVVELKDADVAELPGPVAELPPPSEETSLGDPDDASPAAAEVLSDG